MKFSLVRTNKNNEVHLSVKTAEWLMERIQTDTKTGEIGRLRQFVDYHGDAKGYDRANSIPMVYPAVELAKTENGRLEIVAFNSLVILHVANLLRPEDQEAVKDAAKALPMTMAALTGADGRSVEILVNVDANGNLNGNLNGNDNGNLNGNLNDNLNGNKWRGRSEAEMDLFCQAAYDMAFAVYSGILPKAIERQAAHARSCFSMTLDPQPYYNPSPTPLLVSTLTLTPTLMPTLTLTSESRSSLGLGLTLESPSTSPSSSSLALGLTLGLTSSDMSLYAVYEQMYKRATEEAYDALADANVKGKEAFITAVAQRLCEMGVPQEEAFLHLYHHHCYQRDYDDDACRSIVDAVYAEMKPQGRGEGDMVSRSTRQLINFLNTRYVFRYNTVMGYTEYRPNNTWIQDWQPCDENVINGMTIKARLANLNVRDKDVRRYVRSDMIRVCDPIGDYLSHVSDKWNGTTDHIGMLARCVKCDLPQWEQWFRKWFLSMVAQWLMPHQEYGNSVVPLLISPQGDGKTTFCRNILPKELRWGFLENLDVSEKRQTLQAMHNFLLINLDEFNQISPALQQGFLKNVIQLPCVKIKRPYGKHVEEFRRYASFIATTNEGNVLSDPTGNRRFICVQLTAPIDTTYKPNYEALYGQAYTLIMSRHERWWFTAEEVKAIIKHNRRFEVQPPAVQYFNEYYDVVDNEVDGQWLSPTAIYDHLRHIAGSGLKANGVAAFGRYLKNIPGIMQKRTANGREYLVRPKA